MPEPRNHSWVLGPYWQMITSRVISSPEAAGGFSAGGFSAAGASVATGAAVGAAVGWAPPAPQAARDRTIITASSRAKDFFIASFLLSYVKDRHIAVL